MHNSCTLNQFQREGIIRINDNGSILEINEQAQNLLGCYTPYDYNLFHDFNFIDSNTFESIPSESVLDHHTHCIIKINEESKHKYISASFYQSKSSEEYLISLYDNSILIEEIVKLKKQEYDQRLLVSSINDIIFEVNKDGIFLNYWTNKPEILIHPPSTFIGRPLTDILPFDISNHVLSLIRNSITERKENTFEYELTYPNYGPNWYSLTIKIIPGQSEIVALVITDITKQKEYQDELTFWNQKFYQAFHFSGIGTTLTALDGYLIEGNKTVSEILGYSLEELKNIRSIDITHPEDREYDLKVRQDLIEGKKNYHTFLKRYLHKHGYYVWCSITISLVRDKNNTPMYFIVQLVDMTEFIRKKEELKLEKKKLENTKAHLEAKILQIEEANHIIAHNLLSPIANIKMLIDSLKTSQENELKLMYLDMLKNSCDELDETVEDLNTINSEINNLSYTDEVEICDLDAIITKIIELKQPIIIQKKAIITTDFAIKTIKTQRLALFSIVEQLIDNALKFTDPNRIPTIHVSTYPNEDTTVLAIMDNGLGIDLERFKSQLFMFKKIFHRGFDSKGIGLNIVKYQIESIGGKIDVTSTVGKGTTFFVKFPYL